MWDSGTMETIEDILSHTPSRVPSFQQAAYDSTIYHALHSQTFQHLLHLGILETKSN